MFVQNQTFKSLSIDVFRCAGTTFGGGWGKPKLLCQWHSCVQDSARYTVHPISVCAVQPRGSTERCGPVPGAGGEAAGAGRATSRNGSHVPSARWRHLSPRQPRFPGRDPRRSAPGGHRRGAGDTGSSRNWALQRVAVSPVHLDVLRDLPACSSSCTVCMRCVSPSLPAEPAARLWLFGTSCPLPRLPRWRGCAERLSWHSTAGCEQHDHGNSTSVSSHGTTSRRGTSVWLLVGIVS